jgi:CelD/BcsL family acetyltransferase involved in cellulose biosynthesis
MKTFVVPLRDVQAGDMGRWRELAAVALEPNPFFEPEYLLPQARALGELDQVALAVAADGDAWIGCMPIRRQRSWRRIPLPNSSIWRGSPALPALVGSPLISSLHPHDAAAALLGSVARSRGSYFTAFEWLVEDGPVHRAICGATEATGLRSLRFERFERAFLKRRPEPDYLQRAVKGKHRAVMRTRWRRLQEQEGEPQIVDRAGDEAAVAQLIELEGRSHLAEHGMVLISNPAYVRFFHEMCEAFAARGRLQLLSLQVGDRTIAMKCNILADPGIFYFKIAYDENYAKFSPGIRLETEMYTLFHERAQASWVDSCSAPRNEMNNRLLPDRRSFVTLTVLDPTIRALATVPAIRGVRHLRDLRDRRSAARTEPADRS